MKKITKKAIKKSLLTPLQAKRVAILKDAVQQTKLGAYEPRSSNGYVVSNQLEAGICDLYYEKSSTAQLKPFLPKLINSKKPCAICIKGGLFISAIRKFNHFTIDDAYEEGLSSNASDKIRKVFGRTNADLMERYFEGGDPSKSSDDSDNNCDPWKALSDEERFLTICANAIKNKGIFKPKQVKFKMNVNIVYEENSMY